MGLYACMLLLTLLHMAILFVFTDPNPDWKPIATAYLGSAADGRLLHLGRPAHLEPDEESGGGRHATFVVFLMLWVINWIGTFVGPTAQAILNQLSLTDHFDDFSRGVIDTKHLVFYLSFISLGLFLTAKSVDSERWRG